MLRKLCLGCDIDFDDPEQLCLQGSLILADPSLRDPNFFRSVFRGEKAEKNPWKSNTLEWTADSPPPHGNWEVLPTVYRGPYEYGTPGRDSDYWPQNEPA